MQMEKMKGMATRLLTAPAAEPGLLSPPGAIVYPGFTSGSGVVGTAEKVKGKI